jgi:hypothetical protein
VICSRAHRVLRGAASALALVTAASPLVGSLHAAAVRHVACPEDGELVDAPPQAARQEAGRSTNSPAPLAERDPPAAPVSGQDHQHCAVVAQAHLRARQQSRSAVGTIPPVFTPVSAVSAMPRPRTAALYLLAPKASPPLV